MRIRDRKVVAISPPANERSSEDDSIIRAMIETLISIWRRVLCRTDIAITDNFFERGGTPDSVAVLFRAIKEAGLGTHSPLFIYQAPTIELLADLLIKRGPLPLAGVLPLKIGQENKAVFLAHGIGGNVMQFFHLAKHFESAHSIYGLQARGTDGLQAPCETVEEMAEFHFRAVRKIQPKGPYFLVGYSLGGLVMLELARQMASVGEKIALLAMIESFPRLRDVPIAPRLRVHYRVALYRMKKLRDLGFIQAMREVRNRSSWLYTSGEDEKTESPERRLGDISFNRTVERVRAASQRSLARYRPRYYDGEIHFIKVESSLDYPDDPRAIWTHLVDQFHLETVPGDHYTILTERAGDLAIALSQHLRGL